MAKPTLASYDETPYPGIPVALSCPDHLASIGRVRGLTPAPPEQCRVLELGCSDGGNLIPLAVLSPQSQFVGIDLSKRQISMGHSHIRALKLKNLQLRHCSITDITDREGVFDYIICHGVFSWVPEVVQEKIFAILQQHLSPQGIGFISYNTQPGWYVSGIIRDMLLYHTAKANTKTNQARLEAAQTFLKFLQQSFAEDESPHALQIKKQLEIIKLLPEHYLLHEYLETHNTPYYFYQFMQQAQAHELAYVGEALLGSTASSNFPASVQQALHDIVTDMEQLEQYIDVLRNQGFRQTLLCHKSADLSSSLVPERLFDLAFSANIKSVPGQQTGTQQFRAESGFTLSTKDPILQRALLVLQQHWPEAVGFQTLASKVNPERSKQSDRALAIHLLQCYLHNLLNLHVSPPAISREPGEYPTASAWTRLQARGSEPITDLWHNLKQVDDFSRFILRYLNGRRNRDDLLALLEKKIKRGQIQVELKHSQPQSRQLVAALDQSLEQLAAAGLLLKP